MKRTIALLLTVLLLAACGVPAFAAIQSLEHNAADLKDKQEELNRIAAYIHSGASAGFTSIGTFAEIAQQIAEAQNTQNPDTASEQVESLSGILTVRGGIHFIDTADAYDSVVLEGDAVLFSFNANIKDLKVKNNSQYYGLPDSYVERLSVEHDGFAYLQGCKGGDVTLSGRSEVSIYEGGTFNALYLDGTSTGAIFGQSNIGQVFLRGGTLFDPSNVVEQAIVQQIDVGGSSKQVDDRTKALLEKYPAHIVEWVFNSTPSNTSDGSLPCSCCGHDCAPRMKGKCCDECVCISVGGPPKEYYQNP